MSGRKRTGVLCLGQAGKAAGQLRHLTSDFRENTPGREMNSMGTSVEASERVQGSWNSESFGVAEAQDRG